MQRGCRHEQGKMRPARLQRARAARQDALHGVGQQRGQAGQPGRARAGRLDLHRARQGRAHLAVAQPLLRRGARLA